MNRLHSLTHAIIPAAGRGLKPYPAWDTVEKLLHPVIDADGVAKPVIEIIATEALSAGIERLILIVAPGDEAEYRHGLEDLATTLETSPASDDRQREQGRRLRDLLNRLEFVVQERPQGLGHAVWCARQAVAGKPFLLMLSDHLYLSCANDPCAQQVVRRAADLGTAVSSVEPLGEHLLFRYGVVGGTPVPGERGLWQAERIREKPTPTAAEFECETAGLRRGTYLCFSGLHVLPYRVMEILDRRIAAPQASDWGELTPALDALARTEAAAQGRELGDLFEYRLNEPVTIRKNQSALVPIINAPVEAERVSVWSASSGQRPRSAVWLKNATANTLDGGAFSVLEDGTFTGEGLMDAVKPGERRLLSYASDLALLVDSRQEAPEPERVTSVRIARGVMVIQREYRDNRVVFFQQAFSQGRYEYTYLLKAVTPGVFRASPARISAMYVPEGTASSAAQTVTVVSAAERPAAQPGGGQQ